MEFCHCFQRIYASISSLRPKHQLHRTDPKSLTLILLKSKTVAVIVDTICLRTRRLLERIILCVPFLAFVGVAHAFDTVILDPGHGGHDRGAGVGYVYEKHMALDTARRVASLLGKAGLRVVMTRDSDVFIPLERRSSVGNSHSNAIFVSIHYNYTRANGPHGVETYHHYDNSYSLAAYIQAYLLKQTGMENRGVKEAGFHVIRATTKNPAVLVECGFVSNSSERAGMLKGSFRDDIAVGIAKGILGYRQAK